MRELRPDRQPCPLVIEGEPATRVVLSHFSAGADATFVHVARKPDESRAPSEVSLTIGYAPFVEGTTIVYDLTDGTMQGKARPFTCKLDGRHSRSYMLLPFQVEQIVVRHAGDLRVTFLDASNETIQAALPFELQLMNAAREILATEYHATDRQGRWSHPLKLPSSPGKLIIRSLLTGSEASLTL